MSWKRVKIGDIFNIEKGVLQSSKCTPGEYTFITAAEDWKTNNTYSHDCEALVFAAAASGSLGRTHYIKGKFISSDLCFILTEKDKINYPLHLKFYHFVFNNLKDTIVRAIKTGTSKEAINYTNFYNYELYYFDIQQQHLWINKLLYVDKTRDKLHSEFDQQQTYLELLRQTILQEAVQGKLTKQDPTDEPATELLKRIKAEKENLIKAGKLKKEKELPPIKDGEIPFELPDGWVWCRFGELIQNVNNGLYKPEQYYKAEGIISLRMYNIQDGVIDFNAAKRVVLSDEEKDTYKLEANDILINRVNSAELVGKAAIVPHYNEPLVYESMNMRVRAFCKNELAEYINLYLRTDDVKSYFSSNLKQAISQASINQTQLKNLFIPLPPLPEQQRIVNKVQQLHQHLNHLEAQVQQSWKYAQQLLQTVLKESFEPKSKVNAIEKELSALYKAF